jgi:hypothetical protein
MTSTELRQTRESWLENAIDGMRPRFVEVGYPLPEKVHVSVGFGAFGARRENAIIEGQTWKREASVDDVNHVFISPELGDTAQVLAVLIHELVHVTLDNEDGHKGRFAEIATRLGLEGKMTEATPGPVLAFELITMAASLGDYPHGKIDLEKLVARQPVGPDGKPVRVRVHSAPGAQTNRYHNVICEKDGYRVRMTQKWIDAGLPSCGVCGSEMRVA